MPEESRAAIKRACRSSSGAGQITKHTGLVARTASGSALVLIAFMASSAQALDECGAESLNVACGPGDPDYPTYPSGIEYLDVTGPMTLLLDDPTIDVRGLGVSVESDTLNTGAISVEGTRFDDIRTFGSGASGLSARINNTTNTSETSVILDNGDIYTFGNAALGIVADTAGLGSTLAQMNGGTITTSGRNSHPVFSLINNPDNTATAIASMNGGYMGTSGLFAQSVHAVNQGLGDAVATLDGGGISTIGDSANGLFSNVANTLSTGTSLVRMDSGDIRTSGISSEGLLALTSGLGDAAAIMTGGRVQTFGESSEAIWALIRNPDSTGTASVSLSGGLIYTGGQTAHAGRAGTDGFGDVSIAMTGGAVTTAGDLSSGLSSELFNANSTATASVDVLGGSITTGGVDAHGLRAVNTGRGATSITVAGEIAANGEGSDAVRADARGGGVYDVDVTAGTVVGGSGAGAAIHTIGPGTGTINVASGATIDGSAGQAGILDEEGSTSITVAGNVMNGILSGAGDDALTLESGSTTSGDASMGDGSDTLTVVAGADITGITLFDGGDDTGVADGFIDELTLRGQALSISGTLFANWETVNVDGGLLSITDGALSVGRDAGQGLNIFNGGTVDGDTNFALSGNMNVLAGGTFQGLGGGVGTYAIDGALRNLGIVSTRDGSVGDAVIVGGDYTGGGALLVDVDFATDTADTLSVGGDVAAPGTLVSAADVSSGRATGNDVLVVDVNGTTAAGDFVLAGGPIAAGIFVYDLDLLGDQWVLTSAVSPIGGVYESAPFILGRLVDLPTLEQRVGQRQYLTTQDSGDKYGDGAWMRAHGERFDITPSASTSESSFDGAAGGLQFGYDTRAEVGDNGQWVFGLTAQIGTVNGSVSNALGFGSVHADGYGIGATATWYGNNGLYFDAQAQANWTESDYVAAGADLASDRGAVAYGASVEVGKRIAVSETRALIPQAQLSRTRVDTKTFTDSLGNAIDLGDNDSLLGRLGLAFEHNNTEADDGAETYYVIGNLLRDFSTGSSVNVAGFSQNASYNDTWVEFGLGGSKAFNDNQMLYGEASYRTSLSEQDNSAFGLTAGFRMQW